MSETSSSLEIRIHLTNGNVESFVQSDHAAIRQILDNLQPQKIFSQRNLILAGSFSMTAYACSAITMVELVMDGFPEWPFPHGTKDIREITKDEFWERYRPGQDEKFVREQPRKVGETQVGYSELELTSGKHIYSEVQAEVSPQLDRIHYINQLLSASCVFARRHGGGVTLVNMANVARFGFHPGPPETPKTAWPAHHKTK